MATFLYAIRMIRPELLEHTSPEQETIMEAHFSRLQEGVAEGKVVLAGPCTDGAFGIVIFEAASRADAAAFMSGDPAVEQGLMSAELHPFRISLMQGRDLG
jgi:uncharacterized protein YciI